MEHFFFFFIFETTILVPFFAITYNKPRFLFRFLTMGPKNLILKKLGSRFRTYSLTSSFRQTNFNNSRGGGGPFFVETFFENLPNSTCPIIILSKTFIGRPTPFSGTWGARQKGFAPAVFVFTLMPPRELFTKLTQRCFTS